MQQVQPIPRRKYTVADWEALPEGHKYELIDGDIYMMARPSIEHQAVTFEIGRQFGNYLLGKQCRVFSEAALRFNENDDSVFVPDLYIICDPAKIRKNYCVGTPDLVIEVLSPSSVRMDKISKLDRYLHEGVREYWVVDPIHQIIDVFRWNNGASAPRIYGPTDKIKVGILDDCEIDLSLVFSEQETEERPTIES